MWEKRTKGKVSKYLYKTFLSIRSLTFFLSCPFLPSVSFFLFSCHLRSPNCEYILLKSLLAKASSMKSCLCVCVFVWIYWIRGLLVSKNLLDTSSHRHAIHPLIRLCGSVYLCMAPSMCVWRDKELTAVYSHLTNSKHKRRSVRCNIQVLIAVVLEATLLLLLPENKFQKMTKRKHECYGKDHWILVNSSVKRIAVLHPSRKCHVPMFPQEQQQRQILQK